MAMHKKLPKPRSLKDADNLHSGRIYVTARLLSQPCERTKCRQFKQ